MPPRRPAVRSSGTGSISAAMSRRGDGVLPKLRLGGTDLRVTAQRVKTLPAYRRDQPARETLGVAQAVQPLNQPQPGGLHDVGRVAMTEPHAAGNGPEQVGVTLRQGDPGRLVATSSPDDQVFGLHLIQ